MLYKLSSKIIANRIKVVLSANISKEQYGFLNGRSIHDAIAIAQEVSHSMHSAKQDALIMKVDLFKAYDLVDWSFFRSLLLKIDLPIRIIRWIMACVSNVRYAVIVNGLPSRFFKAGRGLR